jgi:hypothetical protein
MGDRKKGENIMYYEVPLFDYLNLAILRLLLAILAWEVGVMGEGSQDVWATCLIQCLMSYSRFFSRPYIQVFSKRIFKGERV